MMDVHTIKVDTALIFENQKKTSALALDTLRYASAPKHDVAMTQA